jgi:SPP1 gp7 family putative phage head morphogenesis protein
MTNVNTKIYDKTVDRSAMIRLYERRVNAKVGSILDEHKSRIDDIVSKGNLSGKQKDVLLNKIDDEIVKTFREVNNVTSRSLLDLFSDQVSYTYQNLEVTIGKIWRTERPPKRIAEDVVLKQPLYQNKTLSAGWAGISLNEKKRLEAVIRKGIAENKSINEIALAVRRGHVHNITMAQSKALVVTAVTSVTAQADHAIYKANEKSLKGYQYVAVLDSRTTPLCAHRDGNIYPVDDIAHLPPAHYYCRSTTVPVVKSWEDLAEMEGVAQVRKKNLEKLTKKQIAFYDGQTPLKESYNDWLLRQPKDVQLRHLGDYQKVDLFSSGKLHLDRFTNDEGNSIGIRELRRMTDETYTLPNDTVRFANAKAKLDAMQLGVSRPEDLINDTDMTKTLRDYYILQSRELNGTLSFTNYRGSLIHTKKAMRSRVLTMPPTEEQLKFNPITHRYEDVRLYQPNPAVFNNNLRLLEETSDLFPRDKEYIKKFVLSLEDSMSLNERAVITDNLRILFTRYRKNPEVWGNFKAVVQNQIKFDVMNVSDFIETQIRKDQDILKRLLLDNYIDPVLGATQLDDLSDNFIENILAKNKWEDKVAPKIAKELRSVFDITIAKEKPLIWNRLSERQIEEFYLRFAHRLSLADTPDKDQLAVSLGRDLFNSANLTGSRREWYELGNSILESKRLHKFYEIETFGVQKRRMKSKMSGAYFGPYYDTLAYNIRVTDPRIQEYIKLTRKVELGLRVSVVNDKNRLVFREGYKTYFIDRGILGYEDTRIPITSTSSFSEFPEEFLDKNMVDALNWASSAKYKIDEDYYDFINKLLYFEDDRGKAKYYNELNEFRKYIASRGDSYERFKAMEWLRSNNKSFSNHAFIDHRARIYDRGLIGPQSGETFRPFLNTEYEKSLGVDGFYNFKDQVGSFLGGLNDVFEGRYNSLSFTGRQKVADKWWPELVKLGNHMLRGKPADIRAVLESKIAAQVDGEELAKFYRFAIEAAKLDNYLQSNYTTKSLASLNNYKTALALEQDASSSGAQIIALTTRNKQLAELSNVVPTSQKKRLYDEIAAATYNDPRFKEINKKLGLTEKDLRKAAKAQNMVKCCHE